MERSSSIRVGLLGVLAVVVVFLGVTPWGRRAAGALASPFVSLAQWCGARMGDGVRAVQPGALSRHDRVLALQSRISELEAAAAANDELRRENAELRAAAQLPAPAEWHGVLAEVISRDPERWKEKALVNRGSEDGIVTGAVVLVDGKVLGRVLHCYRHSSELVTILSEECRFGVAISHSEAVGVLQGGGEMRFGDAQPGFVVDYLPKNLSLAPEQVVVTSGLGGWMPGGLIVGYILADGPNGERIHRIDASRGQLHCLPAADFGPFHFVTILVPKHETN